MDRASRLIHRSFCIAEACINPGCDTFSVAREIVRFLRKNGADPGVVVRTSAEEVAWHGIPDDRILRSGELITVDVACSVGGWWADAARTFPVGRIDAIRKNLLSGAWEAARDVVLSMEAGEDGKGKSGKLAELCRLRELSLIQEAAGHGIGTRLHEPPSLTYDGRGHDSLVSGRVYTAEPILTAGDGKVRISDEGCAVTVDGEPTAHFEVTVLVLDRGRQVLGAPDWMERPPC